MSRDPSFTVLIIHHASEDTRAFKVASEEGRAAQFIALTVDDLDRLPVYIQRYDLDVILASLLSGQAAELELLSHIRAECHSHLPIIALIPAGDPALIPHVLQAGARDYILKDRIAPSSLYDRLRCVAESTRSTQRARELESYEINFRHLIEKTADGTVVVNQEGIIRFVNPAAEALFGRSAQELIGAVFGFPVVMGERTELDIIRSTGRVTAEMRVVEVLWEDEAALLASLRDITDRKQVEEALRKSTETYQSLVNSIDGIVWEADAQTTQFTFVSHQAERILGYPARRWIDEPTFWQDHLHPDDRTWAPQFCAAATADLQDHEFEYRMIAADGRIVWLHDRVTVIASQNKPVTLRGVMLDITVSKESQQEIEDIQTLLTGILESALDGVMAFRSVRDETGQIVDFEWRLTNPAAERIVGRTHDDLLGKHLLEEMPGNRITGLFDRYVQVVESRQPVQFEHYYAHEAVESWFFNAVIPLDDGFAVTFSDISERKRAELERDQAAARVQESEHLYRTLASNLPRTTAVLFDHDLRFLTVEGQAITQRGFSKESLEGKTLFDVLSPEQAATLEPYYRAALAGSETEFETEFDDRSYYVRTFPLRNDQGDIYAGLIVSQDITDAKQAARAEAEAQTHAAQIRQRRIELRSLEQFPHNRRSGTAPLTAALRTHSPTVFDEATRIYDQILDLALEQRAYKVEHDVSEEVRAIAERLSEVNAGPRDVIEIHLTALKQKSDNANPVKTQAYMEEGRLVVLELMGHLVSHYRSRLHS